MTKPEFHEVTLCVSTARLADIMSKLDADCSLLGVRPMPPAAEAPVPKKRAHGYANGKRDKGIRGDELVLRSLKDAAPTPITAAALSRIFVAEGFADNSVSPVVSKLIAAKKIKTVGHLTYALVDPTLPLGA